MTTLPENKVENINTWLNQLNESAKAAVSVDCVIFGYDGEELQVLCIDCNMPPYIGKKSLLGDIVENNENIDEAAKRILLQKVGIKDLYLEQVKTFGNPGRHPLGRVITVAHYTIVSIKEYTAVTYISDRNPQWTKMSELEEMAFDHKLILDECLNTLRNRIHSLPLVFDLIPEKFTVVELQTVYEKLLGTELDKRNFRRKIKKIPYIIDLNQVQQDVHHRPAKLFTFDFEKYQRHLDKSKVKFNL